MTVLAACAIACSAGVASAEATRGAGSGGGAVYVAKPEIAKVRCMRSCASRRRAQGGSTLKITGTALRSVRKVVFHGSRGRADDTTARVRSGSSSRVHARVPMGAVSGPVSVETSGSLRSRPTRPITILPAPPPEPNPDLSPVPGPRERGAPRIETGTSRTRVFYGARRAVTFSYRLRGNSAEAVRVELVRASDGAVVKAWSPGAVEAGGVRSVVWNGDLRHGAATQGRYSFRLTAQSPSGAVARSAADEDYDRDAFDLYGNQYPIRGRHSYGGAGARFGSGRSGHSHQGQDVFARCGTPLAAARGGRVRHKAYHSAAGYYLVIDAMGTRVDYVYMHLAGPSPFAEGDRVYTGQRIGAVGESGNARGCHLHFELWRGAWYDGGRPFDPLPALRSWDSWS